MKALEVYQQDILDQEAGKGQPRQQYYTALRDALHRELMQDGYSELLEKLLQEIRGGDMEHLYAVDYAVLMECHSMIVLGHAMRDVTEYVPHLMLRQALQNRTTEERLLRVHPPSDRARQIW